MPSKVRSSLPTASSCTRADTQIPPGCAKPSRRTATLTPSPKIRSRALLKTRQPRPRPPGSEAPARRRAGSLSGNSEGPWLGELDHVTVGHGVSLLHWRSGGVEHHHDTPPYRSRRHQLLAIARERVATAAATRRFLLRRQPWIPFDAIGGGGTEPGLGRGNSRRVGLAKTHIKPHLAVGDVAAGQAAVPHRGVKNPLPIDRPRPPENTAPCGAPPVARFATPVGLCPPFVTHPTTLPRRLAGPLFTLSRSGHGQDRAICCQRGLPTYSQAVKVDRRVKWADANRWCADKRRPSSTSLVGSPMTITAMPPTLATSSAGPGYAAGRQGPGGGRWGHDGEHPQGQIPNRLRTASHSCFTAD